MLVDQHLCIHPKDSIKECYEFVLTSLAVTSMSSSSWRVCEMGGKWPYSCCFLGICSKQYAASLCNSHLIFSQGVLLEFKWCNQIVVLTLLQLGRIPILFHQRYQITIWSHQPVNISWCFTFDMLISLSIDEIGLVWFDGISTIVGYLMPNLFLYIGIWFLNTFCR